MFYVYSTYTRVQPSTPDSAQDAVICSMFNQFVLVFFFFFLATLKYHASLGILILKLAWDFKGVPPSL